MKFQKLALDEALFDNTTFTGVEFDTYDDEFVGTDLHTDMLEGPEQGSDTYVTEEIITAINGTLATIQKYNSIIEMLRAEGSRNPRYADFVAIMTDINASENKHVGQLQAILKELSPNAAMIDKGCEESQQQFQFTNGRLNVQSWEAASANQVNAPTCEDEACTLQDIDDDM